MIAMTIPDDWLPYFFNLEFELLVFNSSSRCTTPTSFAFPKFDLRNKHEEQNSRRFELRKFSVRE